MNSISTPLAFSMYEKEKLKEKNLTCHPKEFTQNVRGVYSTVNVMLIMC